MKAVVEPGARHSHVFVGNVRDDFVASPVPFHGTVIFLAEPFKM
jgi:hypothetical protein